jgi:hypothetical protein
VGNLWRISRVERTRKLGFTLVRALIDWRALGQKWRLRSAPVLSVCFPDAIERIANTATAPLVDIETATFPPIRAISLAVRPVAWLRESTSWKMPPRPGRATSGDQADAGIPGPN